MEYVWWALGITAFVAFAVGFALAAFLAAGKQADREADFTTQLIPEKAASFAAGRTDGGAGVGRGIAAGEAPGAWREGGADAEGQSGGGGMSQFAQVAIFLLCVALLVVLGVTLAGRDDNGYWPWSDTAKAARARHARWESYVREYLTYGFDVPTAKKKATARMDAEATDAERVKP